MTEGCTSEKTLSAVAKDGEELKLEEAMSRLDRVVAALDQENTDLEEALKLYEEGVRLVTLCNRRLTDARRTVEILKINSDGELTQEPFDHKNETTTEEKGES